MGLHRTLSPAVCACTLSLLVGGCGGGGQAQVRTVDRERRAADPAVTRVAVGPGATGIAVGRAGVWVITRNDSSLRRLDPSTGRLLGRPTRLPGVPQAIALGDGLVWILEADGHVVSVNPRDRATRTLPGRAIPGAAGLAVGGGAVWVSESAAGVVRRIEARNGRATAIRVGRRPTDLVLADGALWVADTDAGTVSRIDPDTRRTAGTAIRVARHQTFALTGGQGAIWAAGTDDLRADTITVTAIEPKDGRPRGQHSRVSAGIPIRLAAGAGFVWSTDVGNQVPGTPKRAPGVQRIDPGSGDRVGRPIRVGPEPAAIAVGAGAAWVASAGDGTVTRIAAR